MPNHHFTLIVNGRDMQEEEVINALFESGCDDGTVGCTDGVHFVIFDREADSLEKAVLSATEDIERVQDLKVVRVAARGAASHGGYRLATNHRTRRTAQLSPAASLVDTNRQHHINSNLYLRRVSIFAPAPGTAPMQSARQARGAD